MKTSLLATAVLSTGMVVGSAAPTAWATFVEQASATATFSAAVLAPPTDVTATAPACSAGYSSQLAWTASASTWLDGYEVATGTVSGGPYTVVPLPAGASPTDTTRLVSGLARKSTYYLVVRTTRSAWRAQSAEVVVTTPARNC